VYDCMEMFCEKEFWVKRKAEISYGTTPGNHGVLKLG